MFVLEHKLQIKDMNFPVVNNITIKSSRETISDVAEISLPKYRNLKPADISEGDQVVIHAGYKRYGLVKEFHGIVREITQTQPYKIIAEDFFMLLRKDIISRTFKKIYAGEIIKQLCSGSQIDTSEINMGVFINYIAYRNKSKRFIIQDLARRCGFDAYMDAEKIIFNTPFADADNHKIPVIRYGLNLIDDSLTFQADPDYDRVIAVSESTDGKGTIFKASKGSGKKIKRIYFDNLSKSETIKRAKEIFKDITYKGFSGDVKTFGYPSARHSGQIKIEDERHPEKEGYYFVDSVEKTYGSGYKQKITLGRKAE